MISKGKERYIYVYIDFHLFAACSLFHWILLNLTHWTFDPNQPRKTASSVPSVRPKIRWRSSGLCSGIQKMCAVCAAAAAAARACSFCTEERDGMQERGSAERPIRLLLDLTRACAGESGGEAEGGGGVLKAQGTTSSPAMQHCSPHAQTCTRKGAQRSVTQCCFRAD